ncbi:MAG: hypothetical protein OEZ59_01095 [Deltaproteobacteria bacterium]|nr:hypothetical protein [Deltaproteobacteria bacterium]
MTEHSFHTSPKSPGRLYQCPDDLLVKYGELQPIIEAMRPNLKQFLIVESAVRLHLDGPGSNPVTTVISVPFEGDNDRIYDNLGLMIFQQLWGYYLSTDPRATHHGLTNLVFDGYQTSLVRRETEKFLRLIAKRNDLGGRMLMDYHMACEMEPFSRDTYFGDAISKFLDIHLGVRLYTYGEGVNPTRLFLPISAGKEALERIYYNLEHIIHQNMVAYDELHDHYLPVSEELLNRELEATLRRARLKGNTRKKIIDGLKLNSVLLEDPTMVHHISLADIYYDKLNRIDLLDEASARSRDLFNTNIIRSAEIANSAANVNELQLEERVYIDRPTAVGMESAVVHAAPARASKAAPAAAKELPTEEAAEPVSVHMDGLEEL